MFGLADPGDGWSYMNRSKYTETRYSLPPMSDLDVEDLLAFLQTLTDADLVPPGA
jgi:hypothetical protein